MASPSTPPNKKAKTEQQQESQSPLSFQPDGISPRKPHLKRDDLVNEIYQAALDNQHVVVGSPPASGKTSLLQLLKIKLRGLDPNPRLLRINMTSDRSVVSLMNELAAAGIAQEVDTLETIKNTWLLIDDAQNAYDEKFNPFWEFVVKHIASVDEIKDELKVVIASTYDLNTPKSPVNFVDINHIEPNATEAEARELFRIYAEEIKCLHMYRYCETLIAISKLASEDKPGLSPPDPPLYHLGVIMSGLRVLKDNKKNKGLDVLNEDEMLQEIRGANMIQHLNRCFRLPDKLPTGSQDYLLTAVTGESGDFGEHYAEKLKPFLRSGILAKTGQFRSIAAQWYYNKMCFPGRPLNGPEKLDDLVKLSVKSMSARRLRDAAKAHGFPKEATFQHLFNEAMSKLLPVRHAVIPELNTIAEGADGVIVTGELDFYINGSLKWALELSRDGAKIGEHCKRFDPAVGKYRRVAYKEYLVVDCRPQRNAAVQNAANRCTLFFTDDFKRCTCQMRMEKETEEIVLGN